MTCMMQVYVVFTERQAPAEAELSPERVASFHHDLLTSVIDERWSATLHIHMLCV